ncbi:MAG: DUF2238 domain-containing protein [Deltaproteobacteria bacterium]|nr:DUF2238 domain-containing protein [Deltaproteobacteria bacterium]
MNTVKEKNMLIFLIITSFIVFIWSAIKPHDYPTWALEVAPAVAGFFILLATHNRFRLTRIAYILIWAHAIILMVGGHYTYAEVPLFDWIRDSFELGRNHYDRLGHFAQGFVPAIISREVLIRLSPVKKGRWLFFIVVCIALSISAFYELIEWWVALITGEASTAFLGTQGDIWDTQWDMFLALSGSIISQLLLGRLHKRELERINT